MNLLEIRNLSTFYSIRKGLVRAVDDVSLEVGAGETLGLVGESGCGKTTLGLSVLRILPEAGKIVDGHILLEGTDLLALPEARMRKIRWKRVSMIFQGAMNSLNPVTKIVHQVAEPIIKHENTERAEALERAMKLLELVGIRRERAQDYPHQFSGGMRQRVMIAMSLACDPRLVIADEPVTALDVMVQAQILQLLANLQNEMHLSMMLITHDLSVIAETCQKVSVMYAGKIVESADVESIFEDPCHPYTQALIKSFPSIAGPKMLSAPLHGAPPDLLNPPKGCRFHPRCQNASERCSVDEPRYRRIKNGHFVACHLFE